MTQPFVAVLMGSDSDYPVMSTCVKTLQSYNIPCEVRVSSAHRTPEQTKTYVKDADARGCAVFIAAAGMAAHLAGTVAAMTVKPVVGVPLDASLNGLDSLLSTAQMPGGIPVASVSIGKAGAKNAAILAAQIMALTDDRIRDQLRQSREEMVTTVEAKNAKIQAELA